MNKNIDLTKILKDCPKGWKFYSSVLGEVEFEEIRDGDKEEFPPIIIKPYKRDYTDGFTKEGFYFTNIGECTLFPSREQRDWSKFEAPWYKKEKFDPKTLQPFDKVLACFTDQSIWCCGLFSCFVGHANLFRCCGDAYYKYCIPYNEETKHLLGTNDEPPEYYKFWED